MPSTRTLFTWFLLSVVTAGAIPIQKTSNDGAPLAMLDPEAASSRTSRVPKTLDPTVLVFRPSPMQKKGEKNHTRSRGSVHSRKTKPTSPFQALVSQYRATKSTKKRKLISADEAKLGLKNAFWALKQAQDLKFDAAKDQRELGDVGDDVELNKKHDDLQKLYSALDRIIRENEKTVVWWTNILVGKARDKDTTMLLNEIETNVERKSWQEYLGKEFMAAKERYKKGYGA
ncbi:hypothetical protein H0H93_007827 [Arthromyces matolae]|nr:hypothetical protein H0H93_007827 [Arthromyces matolae]